MLRFLAIALQPSFQAIDADADRLQYCVPAAFNRCRQKYTTNPHSAGVAEMKKQNQPRIALTPRSLRAEFIKCDLWSDQMDNDAESLEKLPLQCCKRR
jgi:hypothetical protein